MHLCFNMGMKMSKPPQISGIVFSSLLCFPVISRTEWCSVLLLLLILSAFLSTVAVVPEHRCHHSSQTNLTRSSHPSSLCPNNYFVTNTLAIHKERLHGFGLFFFLLCFNTYSGSGLVGSHEGSRDIRYRLMYRCKEELTCLFLWQGMA